MNGYGFRVSRGGRGGIRGRGRGGRARGRGGAARVIPKDPCSIYVSFKNPIEAVAAAELLEFAKSASEIRFGRHCYLTFATEEKAGTMLEKASKQEFGSLKPFVDHAFMSTSAKEGKRGVDATAPTPPSKKKKVDGEDEKMEEGTAAEEGGENQEEGKEEQPAATEAEVTEVAD